MKAFTCSVCKSKAAYFQMKVQSSKITSEGNVTQYRKCNKEDCNHTMTTYIITSSQKADLDSLPELKTRIEKLEQLGLASKLDESQKKVKALQRKLRVTGDKLEKVLAGFRQSLD